MRMRLSVNVPVLSVHSTVADPRASMALARRTSTRCCEMRQAPIAMKTVRIRGNSCGSRDMLKVMPARMAASAWPRDQKYSKATSTLRLMPTTASTRTSLRVCTCSAGTACSIWRSVTPMRPISVCAPVAVTSARPWPLTTIEPE